MRFVVAMTAVLACAPMARAEVTSAAPTAFVVTDTADTSASAPQVWQALGRIGAWWSPNHSYSGDPRHHMTLDRRAGGCFCENWSGGSVEHARVIASYEDEGVWTLRLGGALGPLQDMALTGVLTFKIEPRPSGAHVTLTYRVTGEPGSNLDQIAAPVDSVTMEQLTRLVRYAETGAPS
ncbi:MAG TPA: ATPase [Caulobacterales bacterium]|nr:ATPase [Caulobacterales bacterium]